MLYNDKELAAMLAEVKTIAVVGAVDKPSRPVDSVCRTMMEMGFDIIPVHPARKDVWGLTTYPTINDIPVPVDVVNLFRNAKFCPDHARECLQMKPLPRIFWMQSGIISPEARSLLQQSPVTVIEDRCLKVELQRFGITR